MISIFYKALCVQNNKSYHVYDGIHIPLRWDISSRIRILELQQTCQSSPYLITHTYTHSFRNSYQIVAINHFLISQFPSFPYRSIVLIYTQYPIMYSSFSSVPIQLLMQVYSSIRITASFSYSVLCYVPVST